MLELTKKRIIAALYRVREMLAGAILMSVIICTLCVSGPMPVGSMQRDIALALLPVIYIVWNIVMLRKSYSVIKRKESYYVVNLCAAAVFVLLSICAFLLLPRVVYSWVFLVTYLGRFSNLNISAKIALSTFYTIITASIFLAPIGMEWVKKKAEEKRRYIEKMPPMMTVNPLEKKSDNTEVLHSENNEAQKENSLS